MNEPASLTSFEAADTPPLLEFDPAEEQAQVVSRMAPSAVSLDGSGSTAEA